MFNNFTIMGRICNDIDIKTTPNGVAVCSFRVAVDRKYQADKANKQTDFFNVVAWRNTADFIDKYFSKGDMIHISGELQQRQYEDRNHPDVKHTIAELIADRIDFCGGKSDSQQSRPQGTPPIPASVPTVPTVATTANSTATIQMTNDEDYPF